MRYTIKLHLAGGAGEKVLVFEDTPSSKDKDMSVTHVHRQGENVKRVGLGRVSKNDLKRLGRSL